MNLNKAHIASIAGGTAGSGFGSCVQWLIGSAGILIRRKYVQFSISKKGKINKVEILSVICMLKEHL